MSILFGSNSGSCESFARTLVSEAPLYGYNATVSTLDSAVGSLPTNQPVIIITASYEGDPCENAKHFVAYLESKPELDITYAVFGAGHHDWVNTYQKIPTYIDAMIEKKIFFKFYEKILMDKMLLVKKNLQSKLFLLQEILDK
jgi:cytochrome P450/NADPH-cytochrome P450 reductase